MSSSKEKESHKRRIDMLFITASVSTALVLVLIGVIVLLALSARRLSSDLREEMTVEAVLTSAADEADAMQLVRRLQAAPYTKECKYISKADALEEMTAEMGVDPMEFLEYNPFYASVQIRLDAQYANTDSLAFIEPQIMAMGSVKELNYQRELLDAINSNITKVALVLLGLAVLLTIISLTLIRNTIKLTIYSQRFLLYSMKLVGARWSFIRKPFMRRNFWVGVTAAVLACAVLWGGLKLGVKYEPGLTSMLASDMLTVVFGVVFAVGLLITLLCALFSVNRFLRMKSGELYYI